MYITLEELYDMKNRYSKEILELEMKKAVVDDLIVFAEAKAPVQEEVEEEETVEEETVAPIEY